MRSIPRSVSGKLPQVQTFTYLSYTELHGMESEDRVRAQDSVRMPASFLAPPMAIDGLIWHKYVYRHHFRYEP